MGMRHKEVQAGVADWPGAELTKQPWTRDFFSEKELLSHRCSLKSTPLPSLLILSPFMAPTQQVHPVSPAFMGPRCSEGSNLGQVPTGCSSVWLCLNQRLPEHEGHVLQISFGDAPGAQ